MNRKNFDSYNKIEPEDPVSIREYFKPIFKRYNIDFTKPENCVIARWNEIQGSPVSDISICTGVKQGTLFLECSHPAKKQLLRLMSNEIIKKVNGVYPLLNVNKVSIKANNDTSKTKS